MQYYCTDSNVEHASERQAQLDRHVAEFLKRGGKVQQIPPGVTAGVLDGLSITGKAEDEQ